MSSLGQASIFNLPEIVWHGTNQDFDTFDFALLGSNNENTASRAAFFFALSEDTAREYAHQAARRMVPDHLGHEDRISAMMDRIGVLESQKRFGEAEALTEEMERIESDAIAADPQGARVLGCRLALDNPLEIDASDVSVLGDLGGILERAREAGYDGVILRGISDTPSGRSAVDDHVAVFEADRIEIVDVVEIAPEDDAGPEPDF